MWIAIAVGGLVLAIGNAVVMVRLWRSQMYERPQQIAQTVVLWLLPGSAIVVNWFLREPSRESLAADPTVSNSAATDYGLQGVNIHGDPPGGGHG
jgi:hypothetical protein